jgi:hypothetical protein
MFIPPARPCVPAPVLLLVCGVGQPARSASLTKQAQPCFVPWISFCVFDLPETSCACGVVQPFGHPIQSLSDMRRPDARSAEIDRPAGVIRSFQVSLYKVEPSEAVLARNLFAKDNARFALRNETEEIGPEVSLVSEPASFSGGTEGLAGTATCPDWAIVRPSSQSKSGRPDPDPCEEVALRVGFDVIRLHVPD